MRATFELTGERKINKQGVRLYRIRATRDIAARGVRAGDLGGWVSSTHTTTGELRIAKDAWVSHEAEIFEDACVTDSARVGGHARVCGHTLISGYARVDGWSRVYGRAHVFETAVVDGNARVGGNARVLGAAHIHDHVQVRGEACVAGEASLYDRVCVGGQARISGSAYLCGRAAIAGNAAIAEDAHFQVFETLETFEDSVELIRTRLPNGEYGAQVRIGTWIGDIGSVVDQLFLCWQRHQHARCSQTEWMERTLQIQKMCAQEMRMWSQIAGEAESPSFEIVGEPRGGLYRIRAVRDIPDQGVRKGDLGGWVSSKYLNDGTLRISGEAWVAGDAIVKENARVEGNACVKDNAVVAGSVRVSRCAVVEKGAMVWGTIEVTDWARVGGSARIMGEGRIYRDAYIDTNAHIWGDEGIIDIFRNAHCVTLGPFGPYGSDMTIARLRDGGCLIYQFMNGWIGTPQAMRENTDEIIELVADRRISRCEEWDAWAEQYQRLADLADSMVKTWNVWAG